MIIKEAVPPPPEKLFTILLTKSELEEMQIAFNHMLTIKFYIGTQQKRVEDMLRSISASII